MVQKAIIMIGIPGSGKTTWVGEKYPDASVVSADHYPGLYGEDGAFHPELLPAAHGACLRTFIEKVQAGVPLVVVDNTSTMVAEIAPYAATAQAYGYTLELHVLHADPTKAFARNIHGVPLKDCQAMADRVEGLQCPPWWKRIDHFQ